MPSVWIRDATDNWVLAGSPVTALTTGDGGVTPSALGTAAIGTDTDSARADHAHAGTLISLTDTPSGFGGIAASGHVAAVNGDGNALEFIAPTSVGVQIPYAADTDTPEPLGAALDDGADDEVARFDHVHTGTFTGFN